MAPSCKGTVTNYRAMAVVPLHAKPTMEQTFKYVLRLACVSNIVASALQAALREACDQKLLIPLRCMAHSANLVIKDIMVCPPM